MGRLGSFPHGIAILTAADYFTVSLRQAAYQSVAPHVAAHPPYFEPLAWHLLRSKLRHWDKGLRELAAAALAGERERLSTGAGPITCVCTMLSRP